MDPWLIVGAVFIALTPIAGFLGFFITKKLIEKQLKENPPITEQQIRTMFLQMGRKPSEAQIRSIMNNIKGAKKSTYKKRK